jgi:hypothetical protein
MFFSYSSCDYAFALEPFVLHFFFYFFIFALDCFRAAVAGDDCVYIFVTIFFFVISAIALLFYSADGLRRRVRDLSHCSGREYVPFL